jgi:hypothetical protein
MRSAMGEAVLIAKGAKDAKGAKKIGAFSSLAFLRAIRLFAPFASGRCRRTAAAPRLSPSP